jgi:hypothetical protein
MDTNKPNEGDTTAGDLLVNAGPIAEYITSLGVPVEKEEVYYLARAKKWPIGKYGAYLVASKTRLSRHAEKITRGPTAA